MACSIEMLPCENCGREVPRYAIYLRRNEDGERMFVCAVCAGEEEEEPATLEPAPISSDQPDCA